jgi:hypothetical protein
LGTGVFGDRARAGTKTSGDASSGGRKDAGVGGAFRIGAADCTAPFASLAIITKSLGIGEISSDGGAHNRIAFVETEIGDVAELRDPGVGNERWRGWLVGL